MQSRQFYWLLLLAAVSFSLPLANAANIIIRDIQVRGLERVSPGAVYAHLPVDVGDQFDTADAGKLVSALYKSGLFDDIAVGVDNNILVIEVDERPAIADITFEGNKDIETDQLKEALKKAGIAKGKVFNRTVLAELEKELRQQYFSRGKYNLKIKTDVKPLEQNRVDIDINISEGVVTKIKKVNIIGNNKFDDEELMDDFKSGIPSWWAILSSRDEYSKQKLSGDLETLRSHYLDRGYLNFNIDSTQVTITPDKKDIFIDVNVDEGDLFTISDVTLSGDLIFSEAQLREELQLKVGEVFSRSKITESTAAIKDKLGDDGYAFAEIDVIPDIDQQNKKVALNLVVSPGKRVYVRRISFSGNSKTRDEVFRREMRQLEGAWYSSSNVKRSRVRLQRLKFVETVNIERKRVPDRDDLIDLDISVTERLAGSFSAGVGYSQNQGALFNLNLTQDNAFGTGKRLAMNFDNSRVNTVYSLSYINPYYTIDGISRGFNAFYRTTDAGEDAISDYLADRWGVGGSLGVPLTEYDTIRFNLGYEKTEIRTTNQTPDEIHEFLEHNGDEYGLFLFNTTFTHDTRDRTVYARDGNLQRLNLETTISGSDLDYFKASYRNVLLFPMHKYFTLSTFADLAYGEGTGDTTDLPFFEKYYAGGIRSVRGYKANRLGPRASTNDPFGGNFRVLSNIEILFPAPFALDNPSVRMGLFVDAGNVFNDVDDFDEKELRMSSGLSFEWLSPVGPLTFSWAEALNDEPEDETQFFQFSLGGSF